MSSLRGAVSGWKRAVRDLRIALTADLIIHLGRFIMRVRPPERWYSTALLLSRVISFTRHLVRPGTTDASLQARLLHRFFDIYTANDDRFPVPTQVEGAELFQSYASSGKGFVLCAAHVPLVKCFIPWVRKTLGLVVKYPGADGRVDIWNDDRIPAIASDGAVLIHTRSLLRQGGCLLLLADKEQGEFISSNIFRFVGKVHSRVLMCFPRLLSDGIIHLEFKEAPAPECSTEAEVRANLDFLAANVRAILAGDAPPDRLRSGVLLRPEFNVSERSREIERIQLYSRRQLVLRARRLRRLLADPDLLVSDRELYQKRLKLMESELHLRSETYTRSEFTKDGQPLPDPGDIDEDSEWDEGDEDEDEAGEAAGGPR